MPRIEVSDFLTSEPTLRMKIGYTAYGCEFGGIRKTPRTKVMFIILMKMTEG